MFKFFKEKDKIKYRDPFIDKIDKILLQDEYDKVIKEFTSIFNEAINIDDIVSQEKILRYFLVKLFYYFSKIGMQEPAFETFLEEKIQYYFNIFTKYSFTYEDKKNIFTNLIDEFISNDYFMRDFIIKAIDKINLQNEIIEHTLKVYLVEIIEEQTDAYLSDTQYSLLKTERTKIVELLLDFHEKNNEEAKFLDLSSHELHDVEDYLRLIIFLISHKKNNEAIIYCYQGIEKDPDNQGTYFEKLAEIYELQKEYEKAFAFRVKHLYLTNNKDIYFKIKKAYIEHPETREYNLKIINFLREHHQYSLLIEIFLEEKRFEDALEIAVLPDIKIEEKLWVAEHTKKTFFRETLSLYKEILNYYFDNSVDKNYNQMMISCLREIYNLYKVMNQENKWNDYKETLKNILSPEIIKEMNEKIK